MIDLSVVIPSYENAALLERCLAALARARAAHPALDFEVVVVDNGSRDGSAARAAASPLGVRVVALARNRGFAAAVNLGLRCRRGRHVLLLNSDAEIEAGVLVGGVAVLDAGPGIGVVGAALLHPDGRAQRSVHALPDWTSELLPDRVLRWARRRGLARRAEAVGDDRRGGRRASGSGAGGIVGGGSVREVEAVRGAVFFAAGDLVEALGGLDEGYFFFLEETDYCARARDAGRRVVYAPGLRAIHRLGASSKARAPLATRIEYERALDRFLRRRRGPAVARTVRAIRWLRLVGSLGALVLAAPLSARLRRRLRERAGLLLWHLRGRPAEPVLADALASGISADGEVASAASTSGDDSSGEGIPN
ncbi:MAG: glycosyltransferase [Thermoleophilia bacterium]|nr:glycosyltransferase [Thermoleophilia bacterium]